MTSPEILHGFRDASAQYLDWYREEHGDRPSTWRRVDVSFVSLRDWFGGSKLQSIEPAGIEAFKRHRRRTVKEVTIRHDLHALSGFFQFAMVRQWIARNPVREVRMPSDRDSVRIRVLSPNEERRYLEAAAVHSVLHVVARLMLATGLRPSEALGLRGSDWDPGYGRVSVRQGKSAAARRAIRVTGTTASLVAQLAADQGGYLFPGRAKCRPRTKLNGPHQHACDNSGVACCLYDLRHTFASRAAAAGMPLTTLAAILGHSSLRCVVRYVHPSQAVMDEAIGRFVEG